MNELALKYGCNPNQKPSRIYMEDGPAACPLPPPSSTSPRPAQLSVCL